MLYYIIDLIQRFRHSRRLKKYLNTIPSKLKAIRDKDVINVTFVLHEAALWKTEELYIEMLNHPRFNPAICTTLSAEGTPYSISKKYIQLIDYITKKGYSYTGIRSITDISTDIVFYEKPYDQSYWPDVQSRHCNSLIAYVPYGFNSFNIEGAYNLECIFRSFQFYIENVDVAKALQRIMKNNALNTIVTGIPMTDILLKPKNEFLDPWKKQEHSKKRIIWAPHFSMQKGLSWLDLSSFLLLYDDMINLVKKYSEEVQFAFKPHPILYNKLVELWGEKRTLEYYSLWDTLPNCQLETGEYIGLFKHSDAMIHDCGSFLIEYLYTENPVMYTVRDIQATESLFNDFGAKAFEVIYHGSTAEDVEKFIQNVLQNIDPALSERQSFIKENLLPPNGKSACANIIDAILANN